MHTEQMSVLFPDYPPSIRSSDTICSQKKRGSISCSGCLDFEVQSLFYSFVIASHLNLKKAFCATLLFLVLPSSFFRSQTSCCFFWMSTQYIFLLSFYFWNNQDSECVGKNIQMQAPQYCLLKCTLF